MFKIDNTPIPATMHKRAYSGFYTDVFDKMKVGECIKCDTEDAAYMCSRLASWVKSRGRGDVVIRMRTHMPDGYARIWLLPKE